MGETQFVRSALRASLTLCLLAAPGLADSDGHDRGCSVATLTGTFGLHGWGTRPVAPGGASETHSTLALRSYDGKGGVKSWAIVSQGQTSGVTEGDGEPQTGRYEVYPDCTGKVELKLRTPVGLVPLTARFVIVNRGLEIIEVPATAGNIAVARLQRQ